MKHETTNPVLKNLKCYKIFFLPIIKYYYNVFFLYILIKIESSNSGNTKNIFIKTRENRIRRFIVSFLYVTNRL